MWLHLPVVPWGQFKKILRPWIGLFQVVRKLSDAVYLIQNAQAPRQRLVVHFVTSSHAHQTFLSHYCPAGLPEHRGPTPPSPGKLPLQHPDTTLEVVDSVDPTDCYPQQQQLKTSRLLPASAYHQDKLVCIYILPAKLH